MVDALTLWRMSTQSTVMNIVPVRSADTIRAVRIVPAKAQSIVIRLLQEEVKMVQSDKLKKIIAEVKEESSPVITLSNELIADFSKELDSAISELDMIMESIGENSIEDIPDSQIEYYCVKIPALMYYAGQRVEELGMQVDLASNAKKSAQNEAMVKVSGTVQEKKARVEQLTEDKALVEAIYRRAYNSLKVKLEMAEKIYSGLKKSLSKRIAEVDLDRFSKDKYTRDPEDPMEE